MNTRIAAAGFGILMGAASALAVSPTINVTWDESPAPIEGLDYDIDDADPDFPNVELVTESFTWRIWSVDTDNPDDIGDIGDITAVGAFDYALRILRPDNDTPGARDVSSIVLTPQSGHFSDIFGAGFALSRISGDVAGDVTVVKSGSDGGIIALDVLGDFAGHLDAPKSALFLVGGNVTSTGTPSGK